MLLYVVECTETRRIKVGRTRDIEQRFANLQTGCPTRLRVVITANAEQGAEAAAHAELAGFRLAWNGARSTEWFRPEASAKLAEMIRQGRFGRAAV